MKFKILITILFLFNMISPAFSEQSMTLKEAIKVAFENNNEFRASKYALSAKSKDIGIQRSALLPKLRFEEAFTNSNNPSEVFVLKQNQERIGADDLTLDRLNHPNPINNFLTAITLDQAILDRKANINIGIAKTGLSMQNYDYLRKQEEVATSVALAYYDIVRDTKLVFATKKDIEEAQQNLNATQSRYDKTAYHSDIIRASTVLINSKQMLVTAKNNLEVSKRALGLLLGKEESVDIVEGNLPDLSLKDAIYYNRNSLTRNDLKSMEFNYKNAKNNIKLAESDYFPTIGITSSYRFYDHRAPFALEGDNYSATGLLRWNAFDGLRRRNEKSKAQAKEREAWENLEGFKKDVSFQVFSAYIAVEGAREKLRLSEEALKTAKEGRDIVLEKYEKSHLQLVDLLVVQTNLNQARLNNIIQENNYIDALINLSFVSGTILQDLSIE